METEKLKTMEPKKLKTMEPEKVKAVKIKVLTPFRDKFNEKVIYEAGEELEFEPERAEDVVSRELAQYVETIG